MKKKRKKMKKMNGMKIQRLKKKTSKVAVQIWKIMNMIMKKKTILMMNKKKKKGWMKVTFDQKMKEYNVLSLHNFTT